MKVTVIPLVIDTLGTVITETGKLGNKRTSGDHLNNSIVEIDLNTKKSPGDFRRLAVCQTPVENHWLTLV